MLHIYIRPNQTPAFSNSLSLLAKSLLSAESILTATDHEFNKLCDVSLLYLSAPHYHHCYFLLTNNFCYNRCAMSTCKEEKLL